MEGEVDGTTEGVWEGRVLGSLEGEVDGTTEGVREGKTLGAAVVGNIVGWRVGEILGTQNRQS